MASVSFQFYNLELNLLPEIVGNQMQSIEYFIVKKEITIFKK